MSNTSAITNNRSVAGNLAGWLFGLAILFAGVVNMFWGNDPGFGIFVFLLAFIYFQPVNVFLRNTLGFSIPLWVQIILAVFVIWASLGVGELFAKINLMLKDIMG